MSHEHRGICGLCIGNGPTEPSDTGKNSAGASEVRRLSYLFSSFSFQALQEETCWVECSASTCRAQYVVENVGDLNVRVKIVLKADKC